MADCICGHDKVLHDGGGECLATEQGTDCSCMEFRESPNMPPRKIDRATSGVKDLSEALADLARFDTAKCPRCGERHKLDPQTVAMKCQAVLEVSFNAAGGIGHIIFESNVRPGIVQVSGIDGDLKSLNVLVDKLQQRIINLERALHVQAGELVCVCGHGLGDHRSGDGCGQCSCMNFRSI